MIITLSEKRKEKLLLEWSGEITDQNAQGFCDVCNKVFRDHFDLDYIRRKYEANHYGWSFILTAYSEDKPVAAWGVWRNDLDGRLAFQLCDFASVPSARKSGYIVDMLYCIYDELGKSFPNSLIYGYPGIQAYPVMKAAGWAATDMYAHIYHGMTDDFVRNMPRIDDEYVEDYLLMKKNAVVLCVGGKCYLVLTLKLKHVIPAGSILGEISSSYRTAFKRVNRFRVLLYWSGKPSILGNRQLKHIITYELGASEQVMNTIPPMYKMDGNTLDFNGVNP